MFFHREKSRGRKGRFEKGQGGRATGRERMNGFRLESCIYICINPALLTLRRRPEVLKRTEIDAFVFNIDSKFSNIKFQFIGTFVKRNLRDQYVLEKSHYSE